MSSLSTQWNWNVWRVVRRIVLPPWARASSSIFNHCSGLQAPPVADVAVVLLIHAVELHQLVALEGHSGGNPVNQVERDAPAKIVAVVLQPFVGTQPVERLRKVRAA